MILVCNGCRPSCASRYPTMWLKTEIHELVGISRRANELVKETRVTGNGEIDPGFRADRPARRGRRRQLELSRRAVGQRSAHPHHTPASPLGNQIEQIGTIRERLIGKIPKRVIVVVDPFELFLTFGEFLQRHTLHRGEPAPEQIVVIRVANTAHHECLFHHPESERDTPWALRVHVVAPEEVRVRVPYARDERPEEAMRTRFWSFPLGYGVQHPVKAAVKSDTTATRAKMFLILMHGIVAISGRRILQGKKTGSRRCRRKSTRGVGGDPVALGAFSTNVFRTLSRRRVPVQSLHVGVSAPAVTGIPVLVESS